MKTDVDPDESDQMLERLLAGQSALTVSQFSNVMESQYVGEVILDQASIENRLIIEAKSELSEDAIAFRQAVDPDGDSLLNRIVWRLNDARCGQLDDNYGEGFGEAPLIRLVGLTYDRMGQSIISKRIVQRKLSFLERMRARRHIGDERIRWLRAQYFNPREPAASLFDAQPYEQLAKVLRVQGEHRTSRRILTEKLSLEGLSLTPLTRIAWKIYGLLFEYGLSPKRAGFTFLVFIVLGSLAISKADKDGFLVQTRIQGYSAVTSALGPWKLCDQQVSPWIYALDVAVPILSFGEESRCRMRRASAQESAPIAIEPISLGALGQTPALRIMAADLWRWGKGLYALIGWAITSVLLLTLTGVFRRAAE